MQVTIDAHRHQCGVPVPAEVALRLAQHIAADPGVVLGKWHEIGLTCLTFLGHARRRMKGNLDFVLACLQNL